MANTKGKGNQNASKPEEEKLTSFLYIRAHPAHKSAWVRTASKQGKKLSVWVTETLDKAIE